MQLRHPTRLALGVALIAMTFYDAPEAIEVYWLMVLGGACFLLMGGFGMLFPNVRW
jgi:hypothetical protein